MKFSSSDARDAWSVVQNDDMYKDFLKRAGISVGGVIGSAAGLVWPSGTVNDLSVGTGCYGPVRERSEIHGGIDIALATGTPVNSVADGIVEYVGYAGAYGNTVIIEHIDKNGKRFYSFYAHLDSYDVSKGDSVVAGQQIASVGSTGTSTGPHLHFGLALNSNADEPYTVNPCLYLDCGGKCPTGEGYKHGRLVRDENMPVIV